MKHQFELTDELDEQTEPEFQWFSFAQDVERVCKKLSLSKADIARKMEIRPTQLNKLITGKDGTREKIRPVPKYYFLALQAIEFEEAIYQARVEEEK